MGLSLCCCPRQHTAVLPRGSHVPRATCRCRPPVRAQRQGACCTWRKSRCRPCTGRPPPRRAGTRAQGSVSIPLSVRLPGLHSTQVLRCLLFVAGSLRDPPREPPSTALGFGTCLCLAEAPRSDPRPAGFSPNSVESEQHGDNNDRFTRFLVPYL